MNLSYSTDIVIFGGGIAGLWLLKRLRLEGYQAILIESNNLGGGQTLSSQGIVHGGLKYALAGSLSNAANTIAAMPARWRSCLTGEDAVDLTGVKVLSENYYMWSESSFRSKLKAFLGSKSLVGRVQNVHKNDFPPVFANASVDGSLYQLPDFVVDSPSLIATLAKDQEENLFQVSLDQIQFHRDDANSLNCFSISTGNTVITVNCQRLIFAAGEGNADLIERSGLTTAKTQTRPLHMVYLKQAGLPLAYVHSIGDDFSLTPKLTVTSHFDDAGNTVWYLGGELAEAGVGKSEQEQIAVAQSQLKVTFPWLDFSSAQWHSFAINRAEASIEGKHRPDGAVFSEEANAIVAFPTKFTLTPSLADNVVEHLANNGINKGTVISQPPLSDYLQAPPIGSARWE